MYHFKVCVLLSAGFGGTGFSFGTAASTAPSFSLGTGTTTTSSGFSFGGLSSSIAPSGTTGAFGGFGSGFGSKQLVLLVDLEVDLALINQQPATHL